MKDCVFCKIVAKEIPADIVYENERFLAILSIHPVAVGHTLVIPKEHHRWVWDVPNTGEYFEAATTIAHAQRKAFDTDMILSRIHGEEVFHAHIWVYPNPEVAKGDKKDFAVHAQKIREAIGK